MYKRKKLRDDNEYTLNKTDQWQTRETGFFTGSQQIVNSDFIFNHKDFKKKTKGYDKITGEIENRGKPADNQDEIFVKKPEKEKDFKQIKKDKEKNDSKRREAQNKILYRASLKARYGRGW